MWSLPQKTKNLELKRGLCRGTISKKVVFEVVGLKIFYCKTANGRVQAILLHERASPEGVVLSRKKVSQRGKTVLNWFHITPMYFSKFSYLIILNCMLDI